MHETLRSRYILNVLFPSLDVSIMIDPGTYLAALLFLSHLISF
jgi:hypothetical protein